MTMMHKMLLLAGLAAAPLLAQTPAPVPQPGIVERTALPIPKPVTLPPRTAQEATDKFLASKALLGMMKPVWNDEQIGKIIFIGWHNGAAALCDDLEVDSAKMGNALQYFAPKPDANLTPEKRKFFHDNLILDIGLATGWVMAGNFRDLAAFCANAKTEMAAMPVDRHLFMVEDAAPAK
jgi:class 3 adenylate cyclase